MRLFRLNSFVKDTGRKEDAEAEPERQQWDDPMEFLMSCISMSVGEILLNHPWPMCQNQSKIWIWVLRFGTRQFVSELKAD